MPPLWWGAGPSGVLRLGLASSQPATLPGAGAHRGLPLFYGDLECTVCHLCALTWPVPWLALGAEPHWAGATAVRLGGVGTQPEFAWLFGVSV